MAETTLPPLREVIAHHRLSAKKSLGQNFLLDLNLTAKIARASGPLDDATVLEVGPGPGGLTRGLLNEGARHVIAVERDSRCLSALAEVSEAYPGRLTVIEADALTLNEAGIAKIRNATGPVRIVSNLPYNIGTALLIKWLTVDPWPPWFDSLTLMFQKEVAERLVAGPGSKVYGRLSVLAGWRCHVEKKFDVPARAFTPPPKVTSSVVHLAVRDKPKFDANAETLQAVVAAAFGQRRKMLRQSLKSLGQDPARLLEPAGVDPTDRAENLTIEDFCSIARTLDATK